MKKSIIALATVMSIFSGASQAATQGSGTVTFTGMVIDAPCSIDPGSIDQTVDLGQISLATLKNGQTGLGKQTPQPFKIELTDCVMGTLTKVTATFTGPTSTALPGTLQTAGTGEGFSVKLYNDDQSSLNVGTPSAQIGIVDGNNTLNYFAGVAGNGTVADIKAGDFTATAAFELTYL